MKEIFDLDSRSAVTIFSAITVTRDTPQEPVGETDLESHISQAIWKLFDRSRNEAAERLGVNEVDLLLTDARVLGVRIDGNPVINPHGFSGREFEILLAITIVRRDRFVENAEMFEGGSVRAYLIGERHDFSDSVYVEVGDKTTTLYSITPSKIAYLTEFEWGLDDVTKAVAEDLSINNAAAREVYVKYAKGDVSAHVSKKLDSLFSDSFSKCVGGVSMCISNFTKARSGSKLPALHINGDAPLPQAPLAKKFTFDNRRIQFNLAPEDASIDSFVFGEIYDRYNDMNHLARRRIKWLMPTS